MSTLLHDWPSGRRRISPAPSAPPRVATLLPAGVARLLAFGALCLFALAHWMAMVGPQPGSRTLLAATVAVGTASALLALRGHLSGRLGTLAGAAVVLAGVLVAFLAAGLPPALLAPGRWGDLGSNVGDGLSAIGNSTVPYRGVNEWARLDILLGGAGLAVLSAGAAFWRGVEGPRGVALLLLGVLYGVPAVQIAFPAPFLRGAIFGLMVAAFLWLERLPRSDASAAGGLTVAALALGFLVAPLPDGKGPWIDYRNWSLSPSTAQAETFLWDHRYGPLDWPRTGRVMLRIRAPQAAYWKTENLDDFDGFRWGHSLQSGAAPPLTLRRRTQWLQTVQVVIGSLNTSDYVGAGEITRLIQPPGFPLPGGSPGTFRVVKDLSRGDAYKARVYVPRPSGQQLRRAGTKYDPNLSDAVTVSLPGAIRARPVPNDRTYPRGGDVIFAFFGSHASDLVRTDTSIPQPAGDSAMLGSVYARSYALARRLAASSRTPYDFVQRVRAYLARGFTYSETPPARPVPLEDFLFTDRRGYCQQFSGAMALLLRMGGVPARVAAGFAPGAFDDATRQYVVRDFDAHSWVEVWFPGIGWVTFDPTPSIAPARAQGLTGSTLFPAGVNTRDVGRRGLRRTRSGSGTGVPWLPLGAGLGGLALLGAALAGRRARRRWSEGLPDDPALAELESALRRTGRPPAPAVTLAALERRFSHVPGAAEYVRTLARLRFGPSGAPPGNVERRALRRALADGLGLQGRLRAWRALPPRPRRRRSKGVETASTRTYTG